MTRRAVAPEFETCPRCDRPVAGQAARGAVRLSQGTYHAECAEALRAACTAAYELAIAEGRAPEPPGRWVAAVHDDGGADESF